MNFCFAGRRKGQDVRDYIYLALKSFFVDTYLEMLFDENVWLDFFRVSIDKLIQKVFHFQI